MMYAFVYAAEFRGHEKTKTDESFLSVFLRYTVVGYAVALIVSFYVLWSFGTLDGMDFDEKIKVTIVLAFPAAIGVSASRLIL
jgi:putative integral membrane protein (TIGR02587 family)